MKRKMTAMTFQGLEQTLADELNQLGAEQVEIGRRAVYFEGDQQMLYAANMHLYTAIRILWPIFSFTAEDPDELYGKAKDFEWESVLSIDKTFAIQTTVHSEFFTHSQYTAQKLKDAIVDRFREKFGDRPSVNVKQPDIPIFLHISHDQVNLSLNSSGDSLYKRGYRNVQHKAPLNEVLAAGMIKLSGWPTNQPFYDPMCGSATLPIEAGLQSFNIAPCLLRNDYAFKQWSGYNSELYRTLILEAQAQVNLEKRVIITASDQDSENIQIGRRSIEQAKLGGKISLFQKKFEEADPPKHPGVAIINPPYGQRMVKDDLISFYKTIGDVLKQNYSGWQVWVLTSNLEAAKFIGLKPSAKIPLFNGPLDCRFIKYELYQGSKKQKKQSPPFKKNR